MQNPFNQRLLELSIPDHREFIQWLDHPGAVHFRNHLESKVNFHALKATKLSIDAAVHPNMADSSSAEMEEALKYKAILATWDEVVKDKKPQILN